MLFYGFSKFAWIWCLNSRPECFLKLGQIYNIFSLTWRNDFVFWCKCMINYDFELNLETKFKFQIQNNFSICYNYQKIPTMTFYSLERAIKASFPNIGIPQEFFCEIKIFETLIGRELTLLQYNISSETVFLRS